MYPRTRTSCVTVLANIATPVGKRANQETATTACGTAHPKDHKTTTETAIIPKPIPNPTTTSRTMLPRINPRETNERLSMKRVITHAANKIVIAAVISKYSRAKDEPAFCPSLFATGTSNGEYNTPHNVRNTAIFQVALHIALSSFMDHTL